MTTTYAIAGICATLLLLVALLTRAALRDHHSIVPFDHLDPEVQALDTPFAEAIRRASVKVGA